MKWLVLGVLVGLVRLGEGGALRCTSDSQDTSCTTEELEKEPPIQLTKEDSEKETASVVAECQPGSVWESNCHYCRCSDIGVALCTRQLESDCDDGLNVEPLRCKPNTTFIRDCNTCVCLENGLGLCTLEICRRSIGPKKSELVAGKECAPGTFWKSQCNECGCSPNGYSFCTHMACIGQENEPEMRCAPDTMWNNECNTCWCTTDGRAMCTRMGCISDEQIHKNSEGSDNKDTVDPGDHLMQIDEDENPIEYFDILDDEDYTSQEQYENLEEIDKNVPVPAETHNYLEENKDEQEDNSHIVLKRSVCKPNQAFQSECNSCKCASDGQSYTCTHNECMEGETNKEVEVFMENEGVDHIERHSVCKPRGTFYIGCNTCHCNYDGTDYSCTNKPCPLPEDVELFHELKATKSSKNKTQKIVCVANRMFIKDCNTCWCNDDGTSFFCTRKVCVPELPDDSSNDDSTEESLRIIKECRPDEVFELDCNMCRCNPDGKSFSCTRRACVEPVDEDMKNTTLIRKTRGITQEPPKTCQPGQEFRMDCNKCLCDNEGQDFSCTRNDCAAINGNNGGARRKRDTSEQVPMECSPGSVFDRDCNVCRCTTDGSHATCTLKRCSIPNANSQENNVSSSAPEQDPNFRCNPGEQFKRGCNDCSCSADGKSVFCTVRFCDQDITPPPSL